ncbi:MAG: DUF4331 domain-containing protein [Acidobacteriaceae bacterium]|nr:DUF4331 domain-containing protein [Acidobacteriaceae bacterium]MBV9779480.1 DUF4331 domain-containing protein [Acidobacteriaceae bacterium]
MVRFRGSALSVVLVFTFSLSQAGFAASHREAPITAIDQKADITDWFTFVSPENPDKVVMIMNVDPFLEPSNGPNYFPFDPGIRYAMLVDNDHDAVPDVIFEFRFKTEIRAPEVFTGFVGGIPGIPPITSLDGAGSAGLSLRQTYTVTMIKNGVRTDLTAGRTLFAVPSNVGPRTMPDYDALRKEGIYTLDHGIRVFAGTVADPFFIDLGAAFDSLNFRKAAGGGVLTPAEDAADNENFAPNAVAGFNVNSIALEVPITMLTADGKWHPSCEKQAVIGTWATTSRQNNHLLSNEKAKSSNPYEWTQIQRMANALINELIIGTGDKDKWSQAEPKNDATFANYDLNPVLAQVFKSIGIPVPSAPRTDLLPLVIYTAPICPGCGKNDAGPIADLLRLNTGVAPRKPGSERRLGLLAGDPAGYPNGRRLIDDVVDISARAVEGILKDAAKYNLRIGDGVNTASYEKPEPEFPFVAPAYSGRDSHHLGPGQPGCAGGDCPVN